MHSRVPESPAGRVVWILGAVVGAACWGPSGGTPGPAPRDSIQIPYGTQAQREATGSVSTVDSMVAKRSAPTSLADMLVGRVAGLEVRHLPDGRISLRVRGDRSIMANNEPLIVLDGVAMQSDNNSVLQDIDPRDVASITVLKDAGSLAAYGSRGANGVILITTKRR